MRIDKFLWCVRLFKTRSLSGENVRSGRVLMDKLTVKASREIKVGDEFTIKNQEGLEITYSRSIETVKKSQLVICFIYSKFVNLNLKIFFAIKMSNVVVHVPT